MDSNGRQWWLFLIIYMAGFVVTGDTYVWERVETEVEELTKRGQISALIVTLQKVAQIQNYKGVSGQAACSCQPSAASSRLDVTITLSAAAVFPADSILFSLPMWAKYQHLSREVLGLWCRFATTQASSFMG